MTTQEPKVHSKQQILEYLLQTKELRQDLKAQAARVLRHHRSVSMKPRLGLKNSLELIPRLLKQEVEALMPLIANHNQSLSISKRKLEVIDLPLAAAPKTRRDLLGKRTASDHTPDKSRHRSIRRMPPAKPFKLNVVLQRVYGPQTKELQDLTARPATKPRTQSQTGVRKSEALLRPVLQSYRGRRKVSQSAIGDVSTHGSDSQL